LRGISATAIAERATGEDRGGQRCRCVIHFARFVNKTETFDERCSKPRLLPKQAGALPIFQSIAVTFPGSAYEDNARYYIARIYTDQGSCAQAQATLADLGARFAGSVYVTNTQTHLTANGC